MTRASRKINALSGEYTHDPTARTWSRADSPELAIVQGVLRTPLGAAARDPSYGVAPVENAAPNAAAVWRQNVLVALKRWIDRGVLRDVTVESEVVRTEYGHELHYAVEFRGQSTSRTQRFPATGFEVI